MNRSWLSRSLAVVALLALIVIGVNVFSAQTVSDDGKLHVWFFNVGQGDSELIDTPSHQEILIDGGPDTSVLHELNKALPFGDNHLDLVIVSHNHSDHLTGIDEVLKHYTVKEVWVSGAIYDSATYRDFVQEVADKKIPIKNVTAGISENFGDITGTVIYPQTSFAGLSPTNPHDAMVVTDWTYGAQNILMMGDAESDPEGLMVAAGAIKPATILKVGHHGSTTSSSPAFLAAAKPQFAVIEAGLNNSYGLPAPSTLTKLQDIGTKILRTDHDGTILFHLTPTETTYQTGL
ncbi:MAG TPA: MBL fold metallo-hydrolase [Candidatus Saccharimonadales bacterium]|nr:MBL fold metallo-hydrolase [Candidatus Saccharimonadales bacterium]